MKENEVLIGELLALKDDIAQHKHLITEDMRDEWNELKRKTKALEPQLSGTLLSLVKKTNSNNPHHFVGSDTEIKHLLEEFKRFQHRVSLKNLKLQAEQDINLSAKKVPA